MAVKEVLSIPNPILYKISEPIIVFDRSLRGLVRNLYDTMAESNGVGLAAVQIGVRKRVLVIDLVKNGFKKGVFINPKLIEKSDEEYLGEEGCLSVPGIYSQLSRSKYVKIEYQDLIGEKNIIEAEMLMARAVLHEMDHLDGKVFVDQLEPEFKTEIESELNLLLQGKPLKQSKVPAYRKNIR